MVNNELTLKELITLLKTRSESIAGRTLQRFRYAGLQLAGEIVNDCEDLLGKELLMQEVQKFRDIQGREDEPRYRWGRR